MAKIIITDGIALLKLSRGESYALGRKYIVFGINQVLSLAVEETPNQADLGTKVKHGWFAASKASEYTDGSKSSLIIGPKKDHCVRVTLLNPAIFAVYLTFGDNLKVYAHLKGASAQGLRAKD